MNTHHVLPDALRRVLYLGVSWKKMALVFYAKVRAIRTNAFTADTQRSIVLDTGSHRIPE